MSDHSDWFLIERKFRSIKEGGVLSPKLQACLIMSYQDWKRNTSPSPPCCNDDNGRYDVFLHVYVVRLVIFHSFLSFPSGSFPIISPGSGFYQWEAGTKQVVGFLFESLLCALDDEDPLPHLYSCCFRLLPCSVHPFNIDQISHSSAGLVLLWTLHLHPCCNVCPTPLGEIEKEETCLMHLQFNERIKHTSIMPTCNRYQPPNLTNPI